MTETAPAYLIDLRAGVFTLSFNRPETGNTMPADAVPSLIAELRTLRDNPAVRCVLIRGEGKNFSAGGDVKGFAKALELTPQERADNFRSRLDLVSALVTAYADIPVPIVAACRGGVAGAGLMYALGADFVLADATVAFVFAHQRVGLSPDAGVSYLLPRIVGPRKACALLLSAAKVDAPEALALGLVSRLVEGEQLEAEAARLATRLARGPQKANRFAKNLVNGAQTRNLAEVLDLERDAIAACVADPDFEEGVTAFIEKRSAAFPSAQ